MGRFPPCLHLGRPKSEGPLSARPLMSTWVVHVDITPAPCNPVRGPHRKDALLCAQLRLATLRWVSGFIVTYLNKLFTTNLLWFMKNLHFEKNWY